MKIQVLQNISFEGPGYIEQIAEEKGHELVITHLYDGESPLPATDYDMMVIMGGPMSIYEEDMYPWLMQEKKAIEYAVQSDKLVLGICLGAQLIADVLGAGVYKNEFREVGWYPVYRSAQAGTEKNLDFLPEKATVFHWHGEAFDIPGTAVHLFRSDATENQSFLYEEKVMALQFHLEINEKIIEDLVYFCEEDLKPGKYVMEKDRILRLAKKHSPSNVKILRDLFHHLFNNQK